MEILEVGAKLLSAGGSGAMMFLVYLCWRFDKRLSRIEWHLFNGKKK